MMEFEFGSTGAAEMSVFQRLLPVKGRKPFRLAPAPVDITSQVRCPLPVPPPLPPEPPEPDPLEPPDVAGAFDEPQPAENAKDARIKL